MASRSADDVDVEAHDDAMDVDEGEENYHPEDGKLDPSQYVDEELMLDVEAGEAEDEAIVCICGGEWKPCMTIGCDSCLQWFHIDCVGITESEAAQIESYICDSCKGKRKQAEEAKAKRGKPSSAQRGPHAPFGAKKSTTPCANSGCAKMARVGSLYCSHTCGLAVAVAQIRKEREEEKKAFNAKAEEVIRTEYKKYVDNLQQRKARGEVIPLLEVEEQKMLEAIRNDFIDLEKNKKQLAEDTAILTAALAAAANYKGPIESLESKTTKKAPTTEVIDCAACGHTFAPINFGKHSITCFNKVDLAKPAPPGQAPTVSEDGSAIVACDFYDKNSGTYCKKLRASCAKHSIYSSKHMHNKQDPVLVCGCPQMSGQMCTKARKECVKHTDWYNHRQASLLLLEISYAQLEKALQFEEKTLMTRILSRLDLLPSEYQVRQKLRNPNLDDREEQLAEKRAFDEATRKSLETQAASKAKK